MAYTSREEIETAVGETLLASLTMTRDGSIDYDLVDEKITDAEAVVDGYLRSRFTVPITPVPTLIRKITKDIVVYYLYHKNYEEIPDGRKDQYANAISILKGIQGGTIHLESTPSIEAPLPTMVQANKSVDDRFFSKETLSTW